MGASITSEILANSDNSLIETPASVWTDATQGQASLSLTEADTMSIPMGPLCRLRITTVTSSGVTKIWPTAIVEGV